MPGGVNHLQSKTEPWRLGFVHGAHPLPPPRERVNMCTNPAHLHFTLLEYTSLHPLHPFFLPYHMKLSPGGSVLCLVHAHSLPLANAQTRAQTQLIFILPYSNTPPSALSIHSFCLTT